MAGPEGKENSSASGFWKSAVPAAGPSSDSISRDVTPNVHGCNGAAMQSSTEMLENDCGCDGGDVSSTALGKGKLYHWHGVDFVLPSALCLAPGCTLEDDVLQFVGSFSLLEKGEAELENAGLSLDFNVVDGSLWVRMPCTIFSDMLTEQVGLQLHFWRERMGIQLEYRVSGSSGLIYRSRDPKVLIAGAYIFKQDNLLQARQTCDVQHKNAPTDLDAEVAFEHISPTDNVQDTWDKCVGYIESGRAKLAVGICDRENQREVFLAYKNHRGDLESELSLDPRFVDLGRVLPGFRLYFSYMMPGVIRHFSTHHPFNLGGMDINMRQSELCNHIIQGGSNELAMEIANGLHSVNFIDSAGRTPLVLAAAANNLEIVDSLLANRADPDYCDGDNVSAVLYAKVNGHAQIYDAFRTKRGADFHASTTDLLDAIEKQQQLRFGLLLEVDGIDINASDEVQGYTPLSHAVSTGKWAWAVEKLIDKGACPTIADSHGTIPLVKAMATMTPAQLKDSKLLDAANMDLKIGHRTIQFAESLATVRL